MRLLRSFERLAVRAFWNGGEPEAHEKSSSQSTTSMRFGNFMRRSRQPVTLILFLTPAALKFLQER